MQADLDVAVLFAINFTEHAECLFFTALTFVLVLLAAGFALCFGESINLT
jgi:hypothetical protein